MSRRLLACALVLLGACAGTETGNPPLTVEIGGGTSAPMGIVPEVALEEGALVVGGVGLASGDACARPDPVDVALPSPVALDLVRGGASVGAEVELGTYCRVDLALATIEGRTLRLRGPGRDVGEVHVEIASSARSELHAVDPSGFALDESSHALLVVLDVPLLFAGVALTEAEREADGSVRIDSTRNSALALELAARLPQALAMYRDLDADGVLDPEEARAGPIATPMAPGP